MGLYNDLFIASADKRIESWLFMKDPIGLAAILVTYLYGISIYLPKYMKNKKAYSLKWIIQSYNVAQIVACAYMVYSLCAHGWLKDYNYICQPVDYTNSPAGMQMLTLVYFNFWIKGAELLETCFFLLRHKKNQVSYLHIYHHTSSLYFAWITAKYAGGGIGTSPIVLNSIIHVIMYSYYFLAALGPTIQKKLNWIKPKITIMQLIQFVLMLIHTSFMMRPSCDYNKFVASTFFVNILIITAFFANFYVQSYIKPKSKPKIK